MDFTGKTIAIGICGGIAAYRACDLIRELYRRGVGRVIPLMTRSAEQFITPLTLQSLSRETVYRWDADITPDGTPVHIALVQQADALLVLPATVNTIGKFANGLADDLLSTTFMSWMDIDTKQGKPVLIAPAMNTRMWHHPLFQENLKKLVALEFVDIIEPVSGHLACGETGEGHLADQESMLQALYRVLHPQVGKLSGLRALVTAGGTMEPIDPVRAITNHSSGKMGLALADELWAMGAEVTLLASESLVNSLTASAHGSRLYPIFPFRTTQDLEGLLEQQFDSCDWLLMAAAVSDFTVAHPATQKIKKDSLHSTLFEQDNTAPVRHSREGGNPDPTKSLSLELILNDDLLAKFAQRKKLHQRLIGFAAESQELLNNAQQKLQRKNLDVIIANDISRSDIGFQSDANEVTILFADGHKTFLERAPKTKIAQQIILQLGQPETVAQGAVQSSALI